MSYSDATDALQSFVGAPALNLGENKFSPNGALNSPSFSRGDVLWTGGANNSGSTVAEGSLISPGSATGASSYTLSSGFTLSAAGSVSLDLDYTNALRVDFSGAGPGGLAAANYNSVFTLVFTDQNGNTTTFTPSQLNQNLSLTADGSKSISSGSSPLHLTINSGTLAAGTYTVTAEAGSTINLRMTAPEPTSAVMMGLGVAAAAGFAARRSRRPAPRS